MRYIEQYLAHNEQEILADRYLGLALTIFFLNFLLFLSIFLNWNINKVKTLE